MIIFSNVTKKFDVDIFRNAHFVIPDKGLTFICGKSGCGKSTLLNIMAGLDDNYDGKVIVDDEEFTSYQVRTSLRYRLISYMNQKDDFIQEMTVEENLKWFQMMSSNTSYDIGSFFDYFQLNDIKNHFPSQLSGGELSLVCILKTLILNRKYILLDEPNAKLDKTRKSLLKNFLSSIAKQYSIVVVSHDFDLIEIADQVLYFKNKEVFVDKKYSIDIDDCSSCHMTLKKEKLALFKLYMSHIRFYKLKYLFSICIFSFLICLSYCLFNIGKMLPDQMNSIINDKGHLTHVHATGLNITNDTINHIKQEPFIDHVDYSFPLLYPPLLKDDPIAIIDNKEYSFKKFPVQYLYNANDVLEENEVVISNSLAKKLHLITDSEIELYVYLRISEIDESVEYYTPEFKKVHYKAKVVQVVEEKNDVIYVSHKKVNSLIRNYLGFDNPIVQTNQVHLYLKANEHFSNVKNVMSQKYHLECTNLIDMANEMLEFNSSIFDILYVFGFICIVIGLIFIITSILSFHQNEIKQDKSLTLLGIQKIKILKLQVLQNLFPLGIATIVSTLMIYNTIPFLNKYFYQNKLFYTPISSLDTFIDFDFSLVNIIDFDFSSILLIVLALFICMSIYKIILFRYVSK